MEAEFEILINEQRRYLREEWIAIEIPARVTSDLVTMQMINSNENLIVSLCGRLLHPASGEDDGSYASKRRCAASERPCQQARTGPSASGPDAAAQPKTTSAAGDRRVAGAPQRPADEGRPGTISVASLLSA